MFGTNNLIGKKKFNGIGDDKLIVTSIFYTLQGEGPYAGLPAVFVRLAYCNLNCSFCDTFFDDGDILSFNEINSKIEETINNHWSGASVPDWVVIDGKYKNIVLVLTGGEPLLQNNINEFILLNENKFKAIQIESNGILNTKIPDSTTLVCSPKCAEKDGSPTKYFKPSPTILDRADCLKFVMEDKGESPYNEIPDWAVEWHKNNPNKEIYISPMNVYNTFPQKIKLIRAEKGAITLAERSTVDEIISFWEPGLLDLTANQKNHEYVGKYCMSHGFKLNLQMHLYISAA
jgi:organic radical activating enzyme